MAQPTTQTTNRQPITTAPPVVTPHRPTISQSALAGILKRRREIKEAEKNLKALKDALAGQEGLVIEAIENGPTWPLASVTPGILEASVAYTDRRNVKWREVAEEYLSLEFCQIVIDETEPTVYPRLVIA